MHHSPPARRALTTMEAGGKRLVFRAEGTPQEDRLPGTYYENDRVTKAHRLATYPRLAQELWERSAETVPLG